MEMLKEFYTLNDGSTIPKIGFGTYHEQFGNNLDPIRTAIKVGYRFFDTASLYETEKYLGQAVKEAYEDMAGHASHMQGLKALLYQSLSEQIEGVSVNGAPIEETAPHVLNLYIQDVRSEVLLHTLEDYGIYISSGSACASNKPEEKSPALSALGLDAKAIDSSIRVSFSRYNTREEVLEFVRVMTQVVPMLRRFKRR